MTDEIDKRIEAEETIETNIAPPRTKEEIMAQINDIMEMDTGTLRTMLSGSCSGCASSTITLKMGIENMLKHYVPEVNRVTGEDDPNFNDPYYTDSPSYDPMDNM